MKKQLNMEKYYYENILVSQNYVAKSNVAWVAYFTSFELGNGRKIHVSKLW